jgi:serine/threonine-protein kinase
VKRFRNEARAAYQLRHPNIVEVLDLDQCEDGSLFIAMEFVAGQSLREAIKETPGGMPVERALVLARGIASGLAAAHARGTVHRDIKPENILLTSGVDQQPKVLDFGIASMMEGSTAVSRTRGLMLTPEYASPEQWRGTPAAELDGRTDLYALGGILYEMLAGRKVFHAHNMEGWMFAHLQETVTPPSDCRPELANWPGLDDLVLRLLARDRAQRPRDAAELVELLGAMRYVSPSERRQQKTDGNAARRPETVVETRWQEPVSVAAPAPAREQIPEPVPQRIFSALDAEPKNPSKDRREIWVVVGILLAGVAIWIYLANRTSTPETHTEAQPANTANSATPSLSLFNQGNAARLDGDYAKAFTLFSQSCTGGDAASCVGLGSLYRTGSGVAANHAKARQLFQQACNKGNPVGCAQLKELQTVDALNEQDAQSGMTKKQREDAARRALEQ